MKKPVFRFAPSPNGALHIGHAYSALLNHELARQSEGHFLLRIENIDTLRCTAKLEQNMLDDLKWLGLNWLKPIMRQSERFTIYNDALQTLLKKDLLYPAFLTRKEIKQHILQNTDHPKDPDGAPHYPGDEKSWGATAQQKAIQSGKPFSWRLDMEKALNLFNVEEAGQWGDIVIARKDTPTSYHLSVIIDDAAQKISHIVRGKDLEAATPLHQLLQKILGLPSPLYYHHRLILDETGEKLSKSRNSQALSSFREQGKAPEDIKKLIRFSQEDVTTILSQII